jgi:putative flippase GtrA
MIHLRRISKLIGLSRISKTLVVGGVATAADFALLVGFVQFGGWTPQKANVPSLVLGALIQFLGNRYFVFKHARHNHFGKQMLGFAAAEAAALLVNAGLYYALVTWTNINFALARPLGTFLVFSLFSYPMWALVFKSKQTTF